MIDEKTRNLIADAMHSAGTIAQEGFAAMVRYQFAEGLTKALGGLCVIALIAWALKKFVAHDFGVNKSVGENESFSIHAFWCGIGIVIISMIFGLAVVDGVKQMLAPEGAAIYEITGKHQ